MDGKYATKELQAFGDFVLKTLWGQIEKQFPEEEIEKDPVALTRNAHNEYAQSISHNFTGRDTWFGMISHYISHGNNTPVVIYGEPGSGKSAFMGHVATRCLLQSEAVNVHFYVNHFVGAAEGSTNVRDMLHRLCVELAARYRIDADDIPEAFTELKDFFPALLEKVNGKCSKNGRVVLLIDALNQLDDSYGAHRLDWLPLTFPSRIRVILSLLPGPVLTTLQGRATWRFENIPALDPAKKSTIISNTLARYGKKLDQKCIRSLVQKKDSYKPLYLVVACEELRVFGVFEKLQEYISALPNSVPELFQVVLKRLEDDFGKQVERVLCLLYLSRGGLLESEILQLLGDYSGPLPQHIWGKILRGLKAYLKPSSLAGEGLLDFFHQQLPKAIRKRYFNTKPKLAAEVHKELAEFFLGKSENGTWNSNYVRSFAHAPYHAYHAHLWDPLKNMLCNLAFIEKKCRYGMTFDLMADYLVRFSSYI